MWLAFSLDADWVVRDEPARRTATSRAFPGIILEWGRLIAAPEQPKPWVDAILGEDLPAGARLQLVDVSPTSTADGWSVALIEAGVVRAGATVELRLGAFYTFFAHAAHARVRAADVAALREHEARLRAILLGAGPDFSGDLVAVEQFWPDRTQPIVEPAGLDDVPVTPIVAGSTVVDEFSMFGWRFRTHRVLADPQRPFADLCRFTVSDAAGRAVDLRVRIETSDHAIASGTPFVVSITHRGGYRVVDAMASLPPYEKLKALVGQIVASVLEPPS